MFVCLCVCVCVCVLFSFLTGDANGFKQTEFRLNISIFDHFHIVVDFGNLKKKLEKSGD